MSDVIPLFKRVITLPNGRSVTLASYVAAWKMLLTLSSDDLNRQYPGFDYFPVEGRVILRHMRHGLHDRINLHIPGFGKGRRWSTDSFYQVWRDARAANSRCVIRSFETKAARRRLAHRIFQEG